MHLTRRLQCIANKVKKGSYVADIGTDHAYIPIYLVLNGICKRAIATDIKDGPLEHARKNVYSYGLMNDIKLKKGQGLLPVMDDDIDCAILSGMGGYLICNIINSQKCKAEKVNYFIIQPMQFSEKVRQFLYNSGYHIFDEELVEEDNKIYEVISADHGIEKIDDNIYFEIGKSLIYKNDPLLPKFINGKIKEAEKIIRNIELNGSEISKKRSDECRNKLVKYKEILKCL